MREEETTAIKVAVGEPKEKLSTTVVIEDSKENSASRREDGTTGAELVLRRVMSDKVGQAPGAVQNLNFSLNSQLIGTTGTWEYNEGDHCIKWAEVR